MDEQPHDELTLPKTLKIKIDLTKSKVMSYVKLLEACSVSNDQPTSEPPPSTELPRGSDFYSVIRSIEDRLQMYGGLTINSASGRISANESSSSNQSSPSSVPNLADESSDDDSSACSDETDNEIFTGAPTKGFFRWRPQSKGVEERSRPVSAAERLNADYGISEEVDCIVMSLVNLLEDSPGSGFPKKSDRLFIKLATALEADKTLNSDQIYSYLAVASHRRTYQLKLHIDGLILVHQAETAGQKLMITRDKLFAAVRKPLRRSDLQRIDKLLKEYALDLLVLSTLRRKLIGLESGLPPVTLESEVKRLLKDLKTSMLA
jgi:hypothetical protein